MHLLTTLLAITCAIIAVWAQFPLSQSLYFTDVPTTIAVGQPVVLKWATLNPSTTVTIYLMQGTPNDRAGLVEFATVVIGGGVGGSYKWTPDQSIPNGSDYVLFIDQGTERNISPQITITGSTATGTNPGTITTQSRTAGTTASQRTVQTTFGTVSSASSRSTQTESATSTTASARGTISGLTTSSGSSASDGSGTTRNGSGLSRGAKAGIGVGVISGVAIVAGVIFFIFRRSKKNGKGLTPELEHAAGGADAPEVATESKGLLRDSAHSPALVSALDSSPDAAAELNANSTRAEIFKDDAEKKTGVDEMPTEPAFQGEAWQGPATTPLSPTAELSANTTRVELPGQVDLLSTRSTHLGEGAGYSTLPEPVHELSATEASPTGTVESPPYSMLPEVVEGVGISPTAQQPDVVRLREELDRIDQEIMQRERLQELRDLRIQVATQLREAGGGAT